MGLLDENLALRASKYKAFPITIVQPLLLRNLRRESVYDREGIWCS